MNNYDCDKIIDELMDNAKMVKQIAHSSGESFLNIAFIIKSGKINALPMMFADDTQKNFMVETVKEAWEEIQPDMIIIVTDAYYVKTSSNAPLPSRRPAEHPQRKECLTFVWESKIDSRIVKGHATIPYDIDEGEPVYKDELKRSHEMKGLFTNILS